MSCDLYGCHVTYMGLFFRTLGYRICKFLKSRVIFEALIVDGSTPKFDTMEERPYILSCKNTGISNYHTFSCLGYRKKYAVFLLKISSTNFQEMFNFKASAF